MPSPQIFLTTLTRDAHSPILCSRLPSATRDANGVLVQGPIISGSEWSDISPRSSSANRGRLIELGRSRYIRTEEVQECNVRTILL